MEIHAIQTPRFRSRQNLFTFLRSQLPHLVDGDCLCITSKLLALAQGRVVSLKRESKKEWMRRESVKILKTPWCWLTLTNGEWCANAGVDESNADGRLILLPKKIPQVTERLRHNLAQHFQLRRLGIIITDTRIYPLRRGTMGVALAHAGFRGLRSYIGRKDLFGRKLAHTEMNIVNAIAVAAVLIMGEGSEQTPLAVVRDAPLVFTSRVERPLRFIVHPKDDLYRSAYYHSDEPAKRHPDKARANP